ncbi:MAG: type II toxin-antitoxin system PemK/MazF family toxin [Acidobacteria bacterium]|nr:type II toxin-antitoxin system PemK/MazF family toxin [Acidobacteriota bacterium]
MHPTRGEVWLIDFGLAGKVRPALVVSVAFGDRDRALITVIPHTTALRGSAFEIGVSVPFLKPGAFLVQGATTFPIARALHRLGTLPPGHFDRVFAGLLTWLGHSPGPGRP